MRARDRDIAKFLDAHQGWIEDRLARRAPHVDFADGAVIPLKGVPHVIRATGKMRGHVGLSATSETSPSILVPGLPDHLPRRLKNWLKAEARAAIDASLAGRADRLPKITAVSIRDTTSRWGSCSATRRLSFSWRLILAPPDVLDYVAAHEAAHLVHMNHGPQFWALCEELAPQTRTARAWLKASGAGLHRVG